MKTKQEILNSELNVLVLRKEELKEQKNNIDENIYSLEVLIEAIILKLNVEKEV